MQTQNFGLLPICTLLELSQFHPSETAIMPGEHDITLALEGATWSGTAAGHFAQPWTKLLNK
jgi:hypothetical protein